MIEKWLARWYDSHLTFSALIGSNRALRPLRRSLQPLGGVGAHFAEHRTKGLRSEAGAMTSHRQSPSGVLRHSTFLFCSYCCILFDGKIVIAKAIMNAVLVCVF